MERWVPWVGSAHPSRLAHGIKECARLKVDWHHAKYLLLSFWLVCWPCAGVVSPVLCHYVRVTFCARGATFVLSPFPVWREVLLLSSFCFYYYVLFSADLWLFLTIHSVRGCWDWIGPCCPPRPVLSICQIFNEPVTRGAGKSMVKLIFCFSPSVPGVVCLVFTNFGC